MDTKKLEQARCTKVIQKLHQANQELKNKEEELFEEANLKLKENGNLKIRDGNEAALRESSFDIREHEQELLIYQHELLQMSRKQKLYLQMEEKPYFARVDFIDSKEGKTTIYLGLTAFENDGITYITDWRTPVANLFYEGGLGKRKYIVLAQEREVDVTLKRQFIIENGKITLLHDTSEAITDNALLQVLESHANSKMQNIVSTIQSEQNKIIRDEKHRYLLINGVAGSGKTAVLLQRIAYLLYQKRHFLQIEDCLMITPNKVFNRYVAEVLPSLGEEDVYRYDIKTFIKELLPMEMDSKITSWKEELNSLSTVKKFINFILKLEIPVFKPIYLKNKEQLITVKQLEKLWQQIRVDYTTDKKILILKNHLIKQLQKIKYKYINSDEMAERIELEGSDLYEQLMAENSSLTIDEVQEEIAKQLADKEFEQPLKTIKSLKFINYPQLFMEIMQKIISFDEWKKYQIEFIENYHKKKMTFEDGCYYLMMKKLLTQISFQHEYKEIFIDEVQDLTALQIKFLQIMYPNARFTLCGDLNQSFTNNSTINDFENLFGEDLFEINLTKSYRNTYEISRFAKAIINSELEPVRRNGKLPIIVNSQDLRTIINNYLASNQRIAIITRTNEEAKKLVKELVEFEPYLVDENHPNLDRQLLILPIKIAKGLEFDNVILYGIDKMNLGNELYTMVTRAMHELVIITLKKPQWLDKIDASLYQM